MGGEVVVHASEGGDGQEHLTPGALGAEVEQRAADGGEAVPAGVGDDAAQERGEQEKICGHGYLKR